VTRELVDKIAGAVLYEGYNLYPYRASSVKNQRRFNFGVLAPRAYAEACGGTESFELRTECLVLDGGRAALDVTARFLHLEAREVGSVSDSTAGGGAAAPALCPVESLEVGGRLYSSWHEAIERQVIAADLALDALHSAPRRVDFAFEGRRDTEQLREPDGRLAGGITRERWPVRGEIEIAAERAGERLAKVTVRVRNTTEFDGAGGREEALARSLVSAHAVLRVAGGEFVSLLEPPEEYREAAAACRNVGVWPVLVGEAGERDTMLASPIILYDYPQIAPESAGDLFDGTEIDEILTLRIMTLTDEEKREMRGLDDRTRQILERTEAMPAEQLMKLHGALRGLRPQRRE
jgi:hydrogenase maturation protease